MAEHIDDVFHAMAALALSGRYTTHADARQKAMGLSYITAEKEDLSREVAALMRRVYHAGRKDVLDAITWTTEDGEVVNKYIDCTDLREFL